MGSRYITENKLIMSDIKTRQNEVQPVCLMGLINLNEKDKTKLEGWVLLVSGDPLIPIQAGEKVRNKISINRLHLTLGQERAIIHSSISQDNHAYLYAGMFSIRNFRESGDLRWDWIAPNILEVLSSHMSKNILKLNVDNVVTLREKHIIRRIIMPQKSISTMVDNSSKENVIGKTKETLKFRYTGDQILLELECPTNHAGYHVGIIFLETFIYEPGLGECKGRSTTYLRAQADIKIPSCVIAHTDENASKDGNDVSGEMVTISVKKFQMPEYPRDWEQKFVDERKVRCVEYRGIAHLINDGDWKEITVEKLMIKRFQKKTARKQNIGGKSSRSSRMSEPLLRSKKNSENAAPNPDMTALPCQVSSETCSQCHISTNVVVMEVELETGKRDIDRASSF